MEEESDKNLQYEIQIYSVDVDLSPHKSISTYKHYQ